MSSSSTPRPLITRLIEQSLPAIIVAGIGLYVSNAQMQQQINDDRRYQAEKLIDLKDTILRLEQEIKQMRSDFYLPRGK